MNIQLIIKVALPQLSASHALNGRHDGSHTASLSLIENQM